MNIGRTPGSFHRRWGYMVSTASLQVFETKSSYYSFVCADEKSIIKMTMQYIKDRTKEYFDDFFSCRKKKCKLKHETMA
jgi:hypothetical protein